MTQVPTGCDPFPWQREFLGVRMHVLDRAETLTLIERRLEAKIPSQNALINVAKFVDMRRDPRLRQAVESCDLINVDGMGIVWGARVLGLPIRERVTGVDLFYSLLDLASRRGERVFLLGARPEVIQVTVERLRERYPKLFVVGYHHGYFWDNEEEVVEEIAASGATMLFVAMSSPMKEVFVDKHRDRLKVLFSMGVGGTFDIVAGIVRRAPGWMQKAGLEWLYRVLQEPKRAYRAFSTNLLYAGLLLKAKLRGSAAS